MSVEVVRADGDALDRWDRYVERSRQGTVFHRLGALEAQAAEAGAELHPLVGYAGEEPVGLLPVFKTTMGPFQLAFSPPPNLRVSYLGPAFLNQEKLTRRKAERRRRRFVDGCLEWVDAEIGPRFLHVRTGARYADLRPFQWNDCEVSVDYTYVVDLSPGADAVMERFSSDARRNVRNADEDAYTIEEGDDGAIHAIVNQVRQRYESQGEPYGVTPSFVTDLADRLDGDVRPYVCQVDGEFVGGIVALEDDETVYRWQGGVRSDVDVDLPVNDLLDWHVMTEGLGRGRTRYDLVGANNPRINRYKSKFGPELRTFYGITRASTVTRGLAGLYERLR